MSSRTLTIVGSFALHVAVAAFLLWYVGGPKKHKAASVAVMGEKKKKEEAKPPPPPPPKPRPKVASATPAPTTPAPPPPSHEPPHPHAPPTVAAPMSNEGGGGKGSPNGTGPAVGSGGGTGTGAGTNTDAPKKAVAVKPTGEDAPCTEDPTKPAPVSRPTEIEYTAAARADGIEGRLVLKVVVDADGSVRDVIVVSSVDPALDAAAIAAVKTWVFKPASRCGKPMAGGTYTLAQRFELGD